MTTHTSANAFFVSTHAKLRRTVIRLGLILPALLLSSSLVLAENPLPQGDNDYDDSNANIFLDGEITFVYVTMDPNDLQDCLDDPWSDVYKVCSVQVVNSVIDETVDNVGIRPRGNTSRDSTKKSWKLSFNEFVPGRQFHGLEKMNINGEHNDVSIIRSKLAWDLFKELGVPSPRAHHVQLKINDGTDVEGMHIQVEQIDEELVEAWFGNKDGNLYKCRYLGDRADLRYVAPGTPETYQNLGGGETYEEHNNDPNSDYTDLADFIDFINNTDDTTFAAGIMDRFSVDNFLRAMAVDVAVGQWDNYWYGANNYYIYHNEDTDRFEYIPYDYDNTYGIDFFGTDWATRPYDTWGNGGYGSTGGELPPLIDRILNIPAYEAQYRRYLRELVGAVGDPNITPETYTDTVGDVFTGLGPHYDIVSTEVSNDADMLYITIELDGPLDVGGDTGDGEYLLFFDTTGGGDTSNPWGRSINATVAHDYFIGSWPDGGGGAQLWEWTGSSWNQPSTGLSTDLSEKADGKISYSLPLSDLDLITDDTFTFDAVATGGSSSDPGVDHLSNPNMSTPDWSTPSTPGSYLNYTVVDATPSAGEDGPFTLGATETKIDQIKTMITPYAFEGSYDNGNMDWGYTTTDFDDSYTFPPYYRNWGWGWDWGLKPYIEGRTDYLRQNVPAPADLPRLFVNEILAVNNSINMDEMGQYEDWVEIYNDDDSVVDVAGMYLTDNPGQPKQWQIPAGTTISAKGFLLIWCDNDPNDGPLHANFKLTGDGEGVGLYQDDANGNVLIDYASYPPVRADVSYGRYPNGSDNWGFMALPTPAAANNPHNDPPTLSDTTRAPESPMAVDPVWVTSTVTDDGSVVGVMLTYDAGGGPQNVTMYDDGAHQDGDPNDNVYGGKIPAFSQDTVVHYYVTATDNLAAAYSDPAAAPSETYSYVVGYGPPLIYINEFMADNETTLEDPDEPGEFPDWIELYNAGTTVADLGGMYLTDDLADPTQYQIPSGVTIPAGGWVLFWADDDVEQGSLHTNFKLGKDGEDLGLFDTDANGNEPIDTLSFGVQSADVSYGRSPDGGPTWIFFTTATPDGTNGLAGDLNCDGSRNSLDIDPFVLALTGTPHDYPEFYAVYPNCHAQHADCNYDGSINSLDIDPFVNLLAGS